MAQTGHLGASFPRPESIITWMRHPVTNDLLNRIGARELQLTHDAFEALPPSRSLEHLREMLVHHRMMPDRGDPRLTRFEAWLDQRLATLKPMLAIHTPIEQFARWHRLRRLRESTYPTRNMDNATRCAKQEITEAEHAVSQPYSRCDNAAFLPHSQYTVDNSPGLNTRKLGADIAAQPWARYVSPPRPTPAELAAP